MADRVKTRVCGSTGRGQAYAVSMAYIEVTRATRVFYFRRWSKIMWRRIPGAVHRRVRRRAGFGRGGVLSLAPKATGRPGYDPADMLKLYLYGYLNRLRSSRRLEAESTRNLELIWLLRGLRPDTRPLRFPS